MYFDLICFGKLELKGILLQIVYYIVKCEYVAVDEANTFFIF